MKMDYGNGRKLYIMNKEFEKWLSEQTYLPSLGWMVVNEKYNTEKNFCFNEIIAIAITHNIYEF
jgi:hypothetical protein